MFKNLFFILTMACAGSLFGQNFTAITSGPVVSANTDSRSANFIDVDGDGYLDIFISNGPQLGQDNLLYLNNGSGGFFRDSSDPLGKDNSASDGASFADMDNDGDPDAYMVTWYGQKNFLYSNDGSGTFTHESSSPLSNISSFAETASWGDYNNDGLVDLYITNSSGDTKNQLYRNDGNGTFTKISSGAWVTDAYASRSVNWVDYDMDGDIDLFVSNENSTKNNLYRNDGGNTFTKVTSGAIVSGSKSSTGSCWGDIDNDGDPDLFVANFGHKNQLFENLGNGNFSEKSGAISADGECSFGSNFADIDNDGDLDLYVCNAFCMGTLKNYLYLNDGQGNFTKVNGGPLVRSGWSYGCAFGDYDVDGHLDLVVANCENGSAKNSLFHNDGNNNHWIQVKLTGTTSNRSAIGAKVWIKSDLEGTPTWQYREISAQSGYCSQNALIAHFGLGSTSSIDTLRVDWPSGKTSTWANPTMDTVVHIVEGMPTGIENLPPAVTFSASPNPTFDSIHIVLDKKQAFKPASLEVIALDGKKVLAQDWPQGQEELSISLKELQLPAGMYLLRLASGQQQSAIRIMLR